MSKHAKVIMTNKTNKLCKKTTCTDNFDDFYVCLTISKVIKRIVLSPA